MEIMYSTTAKKTDLIISGWMYEVHKKTRGRQKENLNL